MYGLSQETVDIYLRKINERCGDGTVPTALRLGYDIGCGGGYEEAARVLAHQAFILETQAEDPADTPGCAPLLRHLARDLVRAADEHRVKYQHHIEGEQATYNEARRLASFEWLTEGRDPYDEVDQQKVRELENSILGAGR